MSVPVVERQPLSRTPGDGHSLTGRRSWLRWDRRGVETPGVTGRRQRQTTTRGRGPPARRTVAARARRRTRRTTRRDCARCPSGTSPARGRSRAARAWPLARLRAEGLSEGDEELPVRATHVLLVRGLRAECPAVRLERGGEAGEVGDVLRSRETPVDVEAGEGLVPENCRTIGSAAASNLAESSRGPPVAHPAVGLVVGAQHVHEVADVVADDRADGAIGRGVRRRRSRTSAAGEARPRTRRRSAGRSRIAPTVCGGNTHSCGSNGAGESRQGVAVVAVGDTLRIAEGVVGVDAKVAPVLPRPGSRCRRTSRRASPARSSGSPATATSRARRARRNAAATFATMPLHPRLLRGREVALGVQLSRSRRPSPTAWPRARAASRVRSIPVHRRRRPRRTRAAARRRTRRSCGSAGSPSRSRAAATRPAPRAP